VYQGVEAKSGTAGLTAGQRAFDAQVNGGVPATATLNGSLFDHIHLSREDAVNSVTHAMTMNGRISGEVKDPLLSSAQLIEQRLALLDGVNRYSLSLWRLPDGITFDRADLAAWPMEYVQVAGSRERLTIEVRRLEEGIPAQYVVGRHTPDASGSPTEVLVPWDGYETLVLSTELFTAAEAAKIFAFYYATGDIPGSFRIRRRGL
jgi:hypothetical protein